MRGRGKAVREQSIVAAFDTARIRADAEAGKARSLASYLDDLVPENQRSERDEDQFFETLDRRIAASAADEQ